MGVYTVAARKKAAAPKSETPGKRGRKPGQRTQIKHTPGFVHLNAEVTPDVRTLLNVVAKLEEKHVGEVLCEILRPELQRRLKAAANRAPLNGKPD
jgi:hypothetical protein